MTFNGIEIGEDSDYSGSEWDDNIVEYVDASSLSYDDYFRRYLVGNRPCVIKSATEAWPCRRNWLTQREAPNFEFMKNLFGSSTVPVADCTTKYYNSQMKEDMNFNDYIDYWTSRGGNSSLLYLKDWHCRKNHNDVPIYDVPCYFGSDWLNEYYTEHEELDDDYMFVYMGPKGTWTPYHTDVFSSYSWSANIVGKKRWVLFEPGEEDTLRNKQGQLIYDIESEELNDKNMYPNYNKETVKQYEIIQGPGEIVFVPSGWHHQVWNLEDTISINHNWINGCNIWSVWISLKKEFLAVIKEVDDCRDMDGWDDHCQLMLKASYGINYIQFYSFLSYLAHKRIAFIVENEPVISFGKWYLGRNHSIYDLKQIKIVLDDLIKETCDKRIDSIVFFNKNPRSLVRQVNEILN